MVQQALRQTYTYYYPDGRVEIIEDALLAGSGKAWVLGSYKPPVYPSPLNVRVGKAGIKVWMVINWLQLCDGNIDVLLERYPDTVTRDDVQAAHWYYEENKEAIDRRLKEEVEGL